MAYETYVATPGATKSGIAIGSDAGGTNNLDQIVGTGQVAIIVEDSVAGSTLTVHETLERALELIREQY